MEVLTSPASMVAWATARQGARIGLVPTMGFLHSGHTSLMDALRPDVDHLVVSIFVNPLQFGAGEDLDRYPRDPEGDLAKCRAHGTDAVFMPQTMYPPRFQTSVSVHEITTNLCGARRPGHFEGVCTVVARLFGLTRATHAIFGEKDYQQLAVIRRMVRDLAIPVDVRGGTLIRDEDGVALSSRNKYLSADERRRARTLHQALFAMQHAYRQGETRAESLRQIGLAKLDVDRLDYLSVVHNDDLTDLDGVDQGGRALVAAYVGNTRLIDNVAL